MLAALASCAISEAKNPSDVDVQLASVTLADDCPTPPPPPAQPQQQPGQGFAKPPPGADTNAKEARRPAQGSCAQPGPCGSPRQRCEPTSMQLSLTSRSATSTTIKIKRVELLDNNGKVLEVLTSSVPTQWAAKGGYVQWDESIAPNGSVKVSYRLNSPNWAKLTGGRMKAHTYTFQLRVTVTIGNENRTVEKQQITPARIAPMVVT
jgi:hypothetical protein